ncbi:S-type pyocin domain-containing protein [Pseudomonas parafulva]|uniref:S-type pyocin domain-containing protein n=1 Tax=Pseudomonas parafulva TaxID=157782 RepID=UPI00041AB4AE|nr:S-type pyocin domain-containing protein [Pseudomonas parafulva]
MSRKKRQVTLPPTFVGAQPSRPGASSSSGNTPNQIGPILDGFTATAGNAFRIADEVARRFYSEQLSRLPSSLEQEVNALAAASLPPAATVVERLNNAIQARSKLLALKHADRAYRTELANRFYGSSPLGKHPSTYAHAALKNIASGRIKSSDLQQALNDAYLAAYTVQLRDAEIQLLEGQLAALRQEVANAIAQAAIQAEAERLAEAQARAHAEAQARAEAEAQARAHEEAQRRAHEEALKAAHAAALARAQAEAEARQAAAAKAAAEKALAEQAIRQANTYLVPPAGPVSEPKVVMSSGAPSAVLAGAALGSAIRSAVSSLSVAPVEALVAPFLVGLAALLYAPKVGNAERRRPAKPLGNYLLTLPLGELSIELDATAQAEAVERGALDLPFRMGERQDLNGPAELFAARTDGSALPSAVPVLVAQYDAQTGSYTVTTDDIPSRTVVWTPAVESSGSSTVLPPTSPSDNKLVGPTLEPLEGRLDVYPDLPDVGFDDYVIIFPIDSGLAPLYVMFKSRRNLSGGVTGKGNLSMVRF